MKKRRKRNEKRKGERYLQNQKSTNKLKNKTEN